MNAVGRKASCRRRGSESGPRWATCRESRRAPIAASPADKERARRVLGLRFSYHVCRSFALLPDDGPYAPSLSALNEDTLLGAEQEKELFVRMHHSWFHADVLRQRLSADAPSPVLLANIEGRLSAALEIRNCLLRVFLKLAVSLVGPFLSRQHPFEELYSEGAVALLRAVEMFDPEHGCRFSTYATTAVRRALERHVSKEHKRARQCLAGEHLDHLPAPRCSTPGEDRARAAAVNSLDRLLSHLPDREQSILIARYGLSEGCQGRSLQQIAERLGISRERVRQLEARALNKLRALPETHRLASNYEAA